MNADELAEQHLHLAEVCVSRYVAQLPHGDHDAYHGAALEALVLAARRFEASRGVPFHTYVWSRMWWAMQNESRGADWHSRLERTRGETLDGNPLGPPPASLDQANDPGDGVGDALIDTMRARGGGDFADTACRRLDVLAALRELPVRSQKVLLASMVGVRHIELAPSLGVHASRVSQIEKSSRESLVAKLAV